MKTHSLLSIPAGLLLVAVVFLSGCKEDPPISIYDDTSLNVASKPQPIVSSIAPPGGGLAGITQITLTGANFSPVKEENTVYFDAARATVLQASATQLIVTAPLLAKDSIAVRVSVFGAELFSPVLRYTLETAVEEFGKIATFEEPWASATDAAGNLYVSMIVSGVGGGIKKFAPDGSRTDFAPAASITKFSGMKVGPGGDLYAVRIIRAIYQIPAAGGSPVAWMQIPNTSLYDLDFDQDGNIWTGGTGNGNIFRVKPDKSYKAFPFNADVRTIRFFGGYVYAGGRTFPDSAEKVVRFRYISADSIGPPEEYINLSTAGFKGRYIYAMNFAADGDLFLGTDGANPLLRVTPAKNIEEFYPGVLGPTIHLMTWGSGPLLYAFRGTGIIGSVGQSQKILRMNMQKNGAPYYGRP
ncbi:MAG TPA: IPT/TIG domain-containing protein [Bacteroidota bacterium]|nr:IPT/TIG domain-containing protein [Bacteroidota bacterium]